MQLTFPAAAPLHSLSWPLPGPAPNSIQIPGPWETRPPLMNTHTALALASPKATPTCYTGRPSAVSPQLLAHPTG